MRDDLLIAQLSIELDEADHLEAGFKALTTAVEALGFGGLVYTSIATGVKPLRDAPPVFLCSDGFSRPFLAHYESAGFARDDFTIRRIKAGSLAQMQWWEEERKGHLTARERNVIATAREEYGITNGISIPTLADPGQIAGASVISDENDRRFELLLGERAVTLRRAVRLFHFRVHADPQFRRHFFRSLLDRLTEADRGVLRYAASGLPLKAYKDAFGVNPGVAANQRTALFRKLGVRNIDELMYIAGFLRLLDGT